MKVKKCPECNMSLSQINLRGKELPWKDFPAVKVACDFNVLGCASCGEFFLGKGDAAKLDEVLESSLRDMTAQFLEKIKNRCMKAQKLVAKKIGITEVYFSELISQRKTPSFQTFNYLKILANSANALEDLNCFEGNRSEMGTREESQILSKFKYMSKADLANYLREREFKNILSVHGGLLH